MAKSDLLSKLKAASVVKQVDILDKSEIFNNKDVVDTQIPIINLVLSGRLDGGLTSGVTVFAGASKSFKSTISMSIAAAYQKKYPDSIVLLYDSEYGISPEQLAGLGVDTSRVLHIPTTDVETLKLDMVKKLEEIERGERVIFVCDSIGNLSSRKELQDAIDEKVISDMSRAKALKSLFRIVTPYFTTKNIPGIFINHIYQEMGLYPKSIMSGGTGIYYSASSIIFITRSQNKDGKELQGYNFNMNVEKSRYLREGTRIPLTVSFDEGISKYSGLFDLAVEMGYIHKPSQGWYQIMDLETGEIRSEKYRSAQLESNIDFWEGLLKSSFVTKVQEKYKMTSSLSIAKIENEEDFCEE